MVNWAHLRPTVLFPSVTSPDWGKTLQSPWQPPSLRSLECFLADSVTISPTTSVEASCPDSVVPTRLHVEGYLSRILSYLCFTCFHFMLLYYFNLRGLCLFLHYINLVYLEYQGAGLRTLWHVRIKPVYSDRQMVHQGLPLQVSWTVTVLIVVYRLLDIFGLLVSEIFLSDCR